METAHRQDDPDQPGGLGRYRDRNPFAFNTLDGFRSCRGGHAACARFPEQLPRNGPVVAELLTNLTPLIPGVVGDNDRLIAMDQGKTHE